MAINMRGSFLVNSKIDSGSLGGVSSRYTPKHGTVWRRQARTEKPATGGLCLLDTHPRSLVLFCVSATGASNGVSTRYTMRHAALVDSGKRLDGKGVYLLDTPRPRDRRNNATPGLKPGGFSLWGI